MAYVLNCKSYSDIQNDEFDHLIKIVFIGDSAVGKSSILLLGVDFKVHMLDFKNEVKVNLTIWDTAGQEKFASMTSSYYRGAHGIFLVYDVTNRASFEHVGKWLNEIDMYSTSSDIMKMVIGNKIDLGEDQRRVSVEEGQKFAKERGLLFQECSPKEDVGINTAFETMINAILDSPTLQNETATKKSNSSNNSSSNSVKVGENTGNYNSNSGGGMCGC